VAELVFNLDEVGISDWEDRKTKTAIVSATRRGQTIHHEISRTVKHISAIACVSAAGESLTPDIGWFLIISPRQPKPDPVHEKSS
jgi:hypothetical protein